MARSPVLSLKGLDRHEVLWQKERWSLKDHFKSLLRCAETGSDDRLPHLLSTCNILCDCMVEVALRK